MASAEALTELRGLMDSVASHVGAPLEKMPVEAHHDQQEAGSADESAALPNPANRPARRQATRTGSGSRRSAVERRRGK